jgi:hypothetical protein
MRVDHILGTRAMDFYGDQNANLYRSSYLLTQAIGAVF